MPRPRMPQWFTKEIATAIRKKGQAALYNFLDRGSYTDESRAVEETKTGKTYTYKGNRPITSLEEAVEFFEVDLQKWEVERWVCNAWDVSKATDAGFEKTTNYQVKVWLKPNSANFQIDHRLIKGVDYSRPKLYVQQHEKELFLIVGCVHRPFHQQALWAALMRFISENKKALTGIIINGDYLDLMTLSTHAKGQVMPSGLTLQAEYESGYQGLLDIDLALGSEKDRVSKYYLFGNHEDRYFRFMAQQDNALLGKALLSPVEAMRMLELGYDVVADYKDGYVDIAGIHIFHGHRFNTTPSKRTLEDVRYNSCIFNHTHRFGSYSDGVNAAYNIGWLGDANSPAFRYKSRHQRDFWQNGFALVEYNAESHAVHPVKVQGGFFALGQYYAL